MLIYAQPKDNATRVFDDLLDDEDVVVSLTGVHVSDVSVPIGNHFCGNLACGSIQTHISQGPFRRWSPIPNVVEGRPMFVFMRQGRFF